MKNRESCLAVSAAFAVIIAFTVWNNGRGLIVSVGAGLLGGALYYFISRLILD